MKYEYPEGSLPIPIPENDEERLWLEAVEADSLLFQKQLMEAKTQEQVNVVLAAHTDPERAHIMGEMIRRKLKRNMN